MSFAAQTDEMLQLSPQSFRQFSQFITSTLGIKMPPTKLQLLQSRLQRRLRVLGLASIEEYKDYLFSSPNGASELSDFINAVTTNKTDFFREPHHFDYLTQTVLPEADPGGARSWLFKLWCAGCSSGEEPYTLAMVLSEYAETRTSFDFSLLATDISTRVLQIAQDAIYDASRIEPVPLALRHKYLLRSRTPGRALVRIVPALRGRVTFRPLNFMNADYGVQQVYDAIFFRNVMIYFDRPTQEAVVNRLCRHLRPGGHLFVGHSESLMGLDVPLRMVASSVYRKTSSGV